ncbi:MAG: LamG domain-containing protein [Pirellulales bacterium]|nr:LamG domain-containing protein [Pirellulales bacterium]
MKRQLWMLLLAGIVGAPTAQGALVNRYSFNDGTANDSVSGQNGIVYGSNASVAGGELILANNPSPSSNSNNDGTGAGGWVDLPNGLVSAAATGGASAQVSIELWVTMRSNGDWRALLSAGRSNGGEGISDSAGGRPYIQIIPRTGDGGRGNDFRVTTSSSAGEGPTTWVDDLGDADGTDLAIGSQEHIVAVLDQSGGLPGSLTVYRNGALMGNSGISGALDLLAFAPDELNVWLGRSQWNDGMVDANYDEVRIYNTALSAAQALDNFTAGPNVVLGPVVPEPTCLVLAIAALAGGKGIRRFGA